MQMPMKLCHLRAPGVDLLGPTARKGPLMGRSGPARQAVGSVTHRGRQAALFHQK